MDTSPNSNNDNKVKPVEEKQPNLPRWVKLSGIIVIILMVLYGIVELTGIGGNHGPGRHMPIGNHSTSDGPY